MIPNTCLQDMVWTRSRSDCGKAPIVRPDPSRECSSHGDEEIILAGERRGKVQFPLHYQIVHYCS